MNRKSPQNRSHGYFRPELKQYPNIDLPVYPRSIGHFIRQPGNREDVKAGEKNFVQLFWGIRGTPQFERNGKCHILRPGHVIYCLPDEPYVIRTHQEECEYRWIVFDGPNAAGFMLSFGYPRTAFHAGPCPHQNFINFEEHLLVRSPYSWRRMFCEICNILAAAGGTMDAPTFENEKLHEILMICRARFGDPSLNIKTLSGELNLDRTTLLRIFRKKMNISPSEYLSMLRLQRALSLLQNPRLSLSEIAEQSGFRDSNYFCRFIRKNTGKRPSQWR